MSLERNPERTFKRICLKSSIGWINSELPHQIQKFRQKNLQASNSPKVTRIVKPCSDENLLWRKRALYLSLLFSVQSGKFWKTAVTRNYARKLDKKFKLKSESLTNRLKCLNRANWAIITEEHFYFNFVWSSYVPNLVLHTRNYAYLKRIIDEMISLFQEATLNFVRNWINFILGFLSCDPNKICSS